MAKYRQAPSGQRPIFYAFQLVAPRRPIKIGTTGTLDLRLESYRSIPYPRRLLFAVMAGRAAPKIEQALLADLKDHVFHCREWFRPSPEVVVRLAEIAATYPAYIETDEAFIAAHDAWKEAA